MQLELVHPSASKRPANAVRERTEVGTREVALIVARIEMVGDVEYLQADRGVVTKQTEPLAHLHVERHEQGIATGLVPCTHEIPVFVHDREREAGPHVQQREYRDAARQ